MLTQHLVWLLKQHKLKLKSGLKARLGLRVRLDAYVLLPGGVGAFLCILVLHGAFIVYQFY